MAPVIVLERDGGELVAALGSPGGSAILAYNAKALVGLLAWDLPLQPAFDLPNVIARGTRNRAAKLRSWRPTSCRDLRERGVTVKPGRGEESGLHGVALRGPNLERFEGGGRQASRRRLARAVNQAVGTACASAAPSCTSRSMRLALVDLGGHAATIRIGVGRRGDARAQGFAQGAPVARDRARRATRTAPTRWLRAPSAAGPRALEKHSV